MRDPRKILIIKPRPLGDVLMATPVARALRNAFPAAEIVFLVEDGYAELLEGNGHVSRILRYPRSSWAALGGWARARRQASFLASLRRERFDAVFDLWCTGRTAGWALATGATWRIGFNHRVRRWAYNVRVHSEAAYAGNINLDCVRAVGVNAENPLPEMFLSDAERTWAEEWVAAEVRGSSGPFVMIAPGAGYAAKRWGVDRFAELGNRLVEGLGAKLAVLNGPQEDEVVRALKNRLAVPAAIVRGTSLRQTAALIGRMRLFVGNDSGPLHLAVAAGVPTVTVLGPTNADFIPPTGPHAEVHHQVPCSPCTFHECPLPRHLCMEGVTVQMAYSAVESLLKGVKV